MECLKLSGLFQKLYLRVFYINIRSQLTFVGPLQKVYRFSFLAQQITQLLIKVLNQTLHKSSFTGQQFGLVIWAVLATARLTHASQPVPGVSKVLFSQGWCDRQHNDPHPHPKMSISYSL